MDENDYDRIHNPYKNNIYNEKMIVRQCKKFAEDVIASKATEM